MVKWLLVLGVVVLALLWWTKGRRDERGAGTPRRPSARRGADAAPATMVSCSHCGVHLPQPEALFDAAGRPFCTEAHRLAGPR